jgi:uncharacterized Zn finger protein
LARRRGRRRGGSSKGEQRRPAFSGDFPPRSKPLEAKGGIRAQSRQGDFGSTWWAKRWQAVLDSFRLGGRLARGRTYARSGQVLSIDVKPGLVTASVQGSRETPYDVEIGVTLLTAAQWQRVIDSLSRQALFVAKLLAGEMPQNVEDVFTGSKLSLFPEKKGDLHTDCSCPDEANPCKHIAAVYYLLGEEFDRDPFLIFRLRGLEREELLARLKKGAPQASAQATEAPPAGEPLTADASAFWALPADAEDYGEVQAPPVTAGLVRRLGKFPFWRGERPLAEVVEPAYVQASTLGLDVFLGERCKTE